MSGAGKPEAYIIAARRTPVMPRGGVLSGYQADELAAPVLVQLLNDAGLEPNQVDQVILGNALYAGGNPARLAALRAQLPPTVPAMTIDTQCCSGLDAILQGARLINAGAADCVLAGGAESFSRSPIRMHRPKRPDDEPVPYMRPDFAPPPYGDPDLTEAAAMLAEERGIDRLAQTDFAVTSHQKALRAHDHLQGQLVSIKGVSADRDGFTRALRPKAALRAPVLSGTKDTGLSAATIACEADGAAAVMIVSERFVKNGDTAALRIVEGRSAGGNPSEPALVPIDVARALFDDLGLASGDFSAVELMEAYAVQAMVTADRLGMNAGQLNQMGGALARGHPIGASGAILAVHLYEQLAKCRESSGKAPVYGLALIAAAGGLGSGLVVQTTC
ncbi:thiolase family protein [Roseibium sp. SCPC15]|uniref:thiolase family protein n=1 Tax=Roseibium sp. SCP15 TaxID=3141376 RepID=UPI0033351763